MTFQQSSYLNPRLYGHYYKNDMSEGGSGSSSGAGASNGSQTTTGFLTTNRVETGTTTTGSAAIKYSKLGLRGGEIWLKQGVKLRELSTVTEEFMLEVGPNNGNATTVITDGIYFRYDRLTNVNWLAISESGGTETATDSGVLVVEDVPVDLQVAVNSDATSVGYYIDDVLVATHTTNIPSTDLSMLLSWNIIKSAGTTEVRAWVLYYEYIQKRA